MPEDTFRLAFEGERLLVLTEGPELLGHVFAKVQPEFGEGFIEHVGVAERMRGRGLGRKLVAAALRWMFSWDEVKVTHLVTRAENEPAVRLYRGLGYQVLHTMRAARRPWPRDREPGSTRLTTLSEGIPPAAHRAGNRGWMRALLRRQVEGNPGPG